MENKRRHYSIFWPVLLIVIGVVLFLNNTGAISGDTWQVICEPLAAAVHRRAGSKAWSTAPGTPDLWLGLGSG